MWPRTVSSRALRRAGLASGRGQRSHGVHLLVGARRSRLVYPRGDAPNRDSGPTAPASRNVRPIGLCSPSGERRERHGAFARVRGHRDPAAAPDAHLREPPRIPGPCYDPGRVQYVRDARITVNACRSAPRACLVAGDVGLAEDVRLQLEFVHAVLDHIADADDTAELPAFDHRDLPYPVASHLGHDTRYAVLRPAGDHRLRHHLGRTHSQQPRPVLGETVDDVALRDQPEERGPTARGDVRRSLLVRITRATTINDFAL